MICKKCNSTMIYFTKFQSCGWKCPKCDWSIVTSNINPLDMDESQYTLSISANEAIDKTAIKTLAKTGGLTIVEARNALISGYTFSQLNARNTSKIAKVLAENNICFSISPDFPYEY